ncbi:MAG: exodeoxyribonuclease VII small subunit [Planctomycetota bacterium]
MSKEKKKSFETSLKELEEIAAELEAGDLPLEKAIAKYEQGVAAYKECAQILATARKRIEVLVKDDKGERLEPFPRASEADGATEEDDDTDEDEEDDEE